MADNSKSDDFPTIRLDDEDRRDYQQKRQPVKQKPTSSSNQPKPPSAPKAPSSGGNGLWIFLVALVALAGIGGCYYLYTLVEIQKVQAEKAEERIAQLENKLSATGEEIGESTVALQVKVTELSNKSAELWEQMDKLWASAWRRNQKEIADLGDRVSNVQKGINENISSVDADVKSQASQLGALKNQLASLADELLALNVQLEQASSDKQANERTIKNLNDKISVLEKRNNTLSGRITGLESEIREIATKVVSSGRSASTPSSSSSSVTP